MLDNFDWQYQQNSLLKLKCNQTGHLEYGGLMPKASDVYKQIFVVAVPYGKYDHSKWIKPVKGYTIK